MHEKPHGPAAVRRTLIAATRRLLEERTPVAISGRDIATAAGVNYGLIHAYFGGKTELLREALVEIMTEATETLGPLHGPDLSARLQRAAGQAGLWRSVANIVADQSLFEKLAWDYPLLRGMLTELTSLGKSSTEAKSTVASAIVVLLGWSLYESTLIAGLRPGPEELDAIKARVFDMVSESISASNM